MEWSGAIAGGAERFQVGGGAGSSGSGEGNNSLVEGSGLRWMGAVAGGATPSCSTPTPLLPSPAGRFPGPAHPTSTRGAEAARSLG